MEKQYLFTGYTIKDNSLQKYNKLNDIANIDEHNLTWLHLNYKDQNNRIWLKSNQQLPAIVNKALRDPDPRPRAQVINGGILIVLKGLNFEKKARPEDMISIRLWIKDNLIISTSNRILHSITEIQTELEQGALFQNSSEFIIRLLNKLNYKIAEFIDDLSEKTDSLDEDIMQSEPNNIRFELAALRRQVVVLKRYLTPQKEVVNNILSSKLATHSESSKSQLHEELDSLKKHLEDLSVIHEQTAILNELLISNISEEMGQRMYKLSLITLIFLPLTFFTGLFGANVGGIPFNQSWFGFVAISVVCIITVIVEIIIFRKAKWI